MQARAIQAPIWAAVPMVFMEVNSSYVLATLAARIGVFGDYIFVVLLGSLATLALLGLLRPL